MISVISYQLSTIISYITNIFIICNFLQLQHLTYLKKKDWHVSNQSPISHSILLGSLPFITYAPRGRGGGSSILYISIVYYMQKGGRGGQDSM